MELALLVLAPLFGAFASFLVGRSYPRLSGVIATSCVAISFIATLLAREGIVWDSASTYTLSQWISSSSIHLPLELRFDALSAVMCLIITGVGLLIHVYSIGYMHDDKGQSRFFSYLNLFVASMLLLVLGASLPVLFIGWEGVGLCSYLLIGFWFTNEEYAKAGRKAFVMNRIGDIGFIIAMAILFTYCGTLSLADLTQADVLAKIPKSLGWVVGLALFFAATGKSAQIPLFTWLPDAMAGPTPVSALIHAATMVTAGVYLMARMVGVVELDPVVPAVIVWTGLATSLVTAFVAFAQNDIKKVLAYSTVSQLGLMFVAVGLGQYWVALFHVVTHAFFKACLFLSAGSVIHGCHHEQDMRKMGGLYKAMPLTCLCYGIATLAIAGIFPLAGYFSKHAILESAHFNANGVLRGSLGVVSAGALLVSVCTAFYMTRSFVMTFLGSYRGEHKAHEAPFIMTLPVLALAALSVVGGWYLEPRFFNYVAPVIGKSIYGGVIPHSTEIHGSEVIQASLPGIVGVVLALVLFGFLPGITASLARVLQVVVRAASRAFYIDELLEIIVVAPVRQVARFSYRVCDLVVCEGSGSGIGYVAKAAGELSRRATTGQVTTYLLMMLLSVAVVIGIFAPTR